MDKSVISYEMLDPFIEFKKVKEIWNKLQVKCFNSFFLSWPWIETWLKTLPESETLSFVYVVEDERPFLAYFIDLKKGLKYKIIYANRGYLNSTGDPVLDEITIEYNGILVDKAYIPHTRTSFVFNKYSIWDELVCPAIDSNLLDILHLSNNNDFDVIIERTAPSYFVKLEKVRKLNNDLLPLLSRNKRSQIRQSMRHYQIESELTVQVARNITEALNVFKELGKLHQKRWEHKDQPGSFSNDYFRTFHTKFITNYFSNVHMLTIRCEEEIVGYLYNFIYENTVLFYQNGFNYINNNQYRPGLVSHYLAINYYAEQGFDTYDFLAGESNYKKSLSTDSNKLHWIRIRKKQFKFKIENAIRKVKLKITNLK